MTLIKCPFCGNTRLEPFFSGYEQRWYLRCFGNDITNIRHSLIEFDVGVHTKYDEDSRKEALDKLIQMWNTRA